MSYLSFAYDDLYLPNLRMLYYLTLQQMILKKENIHKQFGHDISQPTLKVFFSYDIRISTKICPVGQILSEHDSDNKLSCFSSFSGIRF